MVNYGGIHPITSFMLFLHFFNFITQFQKHLIELVKRIDQLYFFLTFKTANKIPFYIKKWWYTYKSFTSDDKSHTSLVNHLLLKPNKTQRISNQLLDLINKSDKHINFFNFIMFRTKRRIKTIIQSIDIIFMKYNKIPDIFGVFNFKLLEFIPLLHKQRLSIRLKLINNMFFELPNAFLGPFRHEINNWIDKNKSNLTMKPNANLIRDKYKRFFLSTKHWINILNYNNCDLLFSWLNLTETEPPNLYNAYGNESDNFVELHSRRVYHKLNN